MNNLRKLFNKNKSKKIHFISLASIIFTQVLSLESSSEESLSKKCSQIFVEAIQNQPDLNKQMQSTLMAVNANELATQTAKGLANVPELEFVRETAEKLGVRVWLFGGTAASFLHYVKWDLANSKGLLNLQKDRFDYDYTNIFRSTQDLDIVVDGTPELAQSFQAIIAEKYPHFLGAKAKWEVRTLRDRMGYPGDMDFKEALLNDADFNNQNTDSNSLGMVEVTSYKNEPRIRDLKHWDDSNSAFLEDTLNNRIRFFRSSKHFLTSRARAGENPEILSVIRLLVKAFQYELTFTQVDYTEIKKIISEFDGSKIQNANALRRIEDTAKKLIMHAVNIEYAINKLDELGLRQKLIAMVDPGRQNTAAWWLNREPLRTKAISMGQGATAAELNINIVAHETNSFLAYESITRSHTGEPNVLISRSNAIGEVAAFGDGFYTRMGKVGAVGTGLTIRFKVDPRARQGTDFKMEGDYIIFYNKKALTVIQESLNFGLEDLLKLAESSQEISVDHSDLALLEKLKRKLNAAKINDELNKLLNSDFKKDQDRLVEILRAFETSNFKFLISESTFDLVAKNIFYKMVKFAHSNDPEEVIRYIKIMSPILKSLDSQSEIKLEDFFSYVLKTIKLSMFSFDQRKEIIFEFILMNDHFEDQLRLKNILSDEEILKIRNEYKKWFQSNDIRKAKFFTKFEIKWISLIKNANLKKIKSYILSRFLDINYKNMSDLSLLQLAVYYKQNKLIDWLVLNRNFNFNSKNSRGFNEIDQLTLSGRPDYVQYILQKRSDLKNSLLVVKERNDDLSPIIKFVRIEPGSFLVGQEDSVKLLTTITTAFEIMSVLTTQKVWNKIIELAKLYTKDEVVLWENNFWFKGESNPVESVSYNEITIWFSLLNMLSRSENPEVQNILKSIFLGHKIGDHYRLPTEAEWEFVTRNRGLANGSYTNNLKGNGKSGSDFIDFAWFDKNSALVTHPVGLMKPLMLDGEPIYDLIGNTWEWTSDWYSTSVQGGNDPKGPTIGNARVVRGGCFGNTFHYLSTYSRFGYLPNSNNNKFAGFRIVRNIRD